MIMRAEGQAAGTLAKVIGKVLKWTGLAILFCVAGVFLLAVGFAASPHVRMGMAVMRDELRPILRGDWY